jgi:hypothetical protein
MEREIEPIREKRRRKVYRRLGVVNRFWTRDAGLTCLLVALLLTVFVMGSVRQGYFLSNAFLTVVFVTGTITILEKRFLAALCVALALTRFAVGWAAYFSPEGALVVWDLVLSMTFFSILAVVVAIKVFRRGAITYHNVCGAVVLYMLVAIVFTLAQTLTEFCCPGSFNFTPRMGGPRIAAIKAEMAYYSMVTVTTVGYGDIVPVGNLARALTVLEAIFGQLYPAIILAWLVTLAIQQSRKKEPE